MSRSSEQQRLLSENRQENGSGPLLTETVKVQGAGRNSETPYLTPTRRGGEITGLTIGSEATVEVYEDRLVIYGER
jgi:hypothetical protein